MGFQLRLSMPLIAACIATTVFLASTVSAQNSASAGPSLLIGYYTVNGTAITTNAVSTLIGPLTPGTNLNFYILTNNPSNRQQNVTEVRISWPGQPKDWIQNSVAFDTNFRPIFGTVLDNFAIWSIDPIGDPGFSVPPNTGGPNLFTTSGTIGNVNAEFLPVTIRMTDDVYGTQTATFLIQIARPSPSPTTPTATPTIAVPAASPAAAPAGSKAAPPTPTRTPTPSPSVAKNGPPPSTSAPTPKPTQTRAPTPSPSVAKNVATNQSPTPTASTSRTAAPTAPKNAPSPAPTTPAPTATKKHNGRRMLA